MLRAVLEGVGLVLPALLVGLVHPIHAGLLDLVGLVALQALVGDLASMLVDQPPAHAAPADHTLARTQVRWPNLRLR